MRIIVRVEPTQQGGEGEEKRRRLLCRTVLEALAARQSYSGDGLLQVTDMCYVTVSLGMTKGSPCLFSRPEVIQMTRSFSGSSWNEWRSWLRWADPAGLPRGFCSDAPQGTSFPRGGHGGLGGGRWRA